MKFRKLHIALCICFALIFRAGFSNIAFFLPQESSMIELITTNQVLKVGKKKNRRITYSTLCSESNSINEQIVLAPKRENEDLKELLKKFQIPFLTFLSVILSSLDERIKACVTNFFDTCPYSLSEKKYLAISVLRI